MVVLPHIKPTTGVTNVSATHLTRVPLVLWQVRVWGGHYRLSGPSDLRQPVGTKTRQAGSGAGPAISNKSIMPERSAWTVLLL